MAKLGTRLGRPHAQQSETRTAAVAHMVRDGHADLLAVLGLADVPAPPLGECPYCTTRLVALCVWHGKNATAPPAAPVDEQPARPACPTCGHPLSKGKHGGYRPCQRRACQGGAQ